MIENYSIDEILNAMEDLQNIDNNKKDKIFRKNLDNNIPKHTLKIIEEAEKKYWNQIHIISDFKLDVDSKYPLPEMEKLAEKPKKLSPSL